MVGRQSHTACPSHLAEQMGFLSCLKGEPETLAASLSCRGEFTTHWAPACQSLPSGGSLCLGRNAGRQAVQSEGHMLMGLSSLRQVPFQSPLGRQEGKYNAQPPEMSAWESGREETPS